MQRKSRLLSIRRLWGPRKASLFSSVRKLMPRRGLSPEEVDRTYAGAVEKMRRALADKLATLPPGSAMRAYVERLQGLAPEKLFDEIYSRVDANPERAGCPPYRILMELATRARPLEDPAWEHVMRCHPCGTEVRTMTRACRPRPS